MLLGAACSDAQLYRGADVAFQEDRVALTGHFCSVDPAEQSFPVKVVFLVDQSPESLGLDPDSGAGVAVQAIVERYLNSRGGRYSFAIIGYGGRPRLLSGGPDDEVFTRQPAQLQNAVQLLRLPSPCEGGMARCRDMEGALSLAASFISGDVVTLPRGEVARTRYVVVHFAAGPPSPRITRCRCGDPVRDPQCMSPPMISDKDCEQIQYARGLGDLTSVVRQSGAPELRYHTFFLRDPKASSFALQDEAIELLQRLSAAGSGAFECRTSMALPDCDKLANPTEQQICRRQAQLCPPGPVNFLGFNLDSTQRPFLIKKLVVANLNSIARVDGQHLDSDSDGLPDDEEERLGTRVDHGDSDGDGIGDMVEQRLALDPRSADAPPAACLSVAFPMDLTKTPMPDQDGDLLNDCEERLLGTDETLPDTDGDGLPDGLELRAGTNYLLSDYLLPPYDHDGLENGDELRQHTSPRGDDGQDALSRAYFYQEQGEGVKALPFTTQPRDITGVTILDISPASTAGASTLRYGAAPLDCAKEFAAPRTSAQQRSYDRCLACQDCGVLAWKDVGDCDFGPSVLVDPEDIRRQGGVNLSLASRSASESACGAGATKNDWRLIVRLENPSILRRMNIQETIVVGTAMRACERYQVRNISLLTPQPDQSVGRQEQKNGINNIYVYFGQGPDGQLQAPGIFSTALVRVRYAPPARRDPSVPEIVLLQEDFVVLGGR